MGIIAGLRAGLGVAARSLGIFRDAPSLLAFPVLSVVLGGGGLVLGGAGIVATARGLHPILVLPLGSAIWFGLAHVVVFLNAALVYNVAAVLHGRRPSIRAGLAATWQRRGALSRWAFVTGSVGIVAWALSNSGNRSMKLLGFAFDVLWSSATYFAIPLILFEGIEGRSLLEAGFQRLEGTAAAATGAALGIWFLKAGIIVGGVSLAIATALLWDVALGALILISLPPVALLLYLSLAAVARSIVYVEWGAGPVPQEWTTPGDAAA